MDSGAVSGEPRYGVSNSHAQRRYIEAQAKLRGLSNLRVITADMNHFASDQTFQRIVSIEMFEHMRNYAALFERISGWLDPTADSSCIFSATGRRLWFVDAGPADWMSRYFFSGGIMPSRDLPLRFNKHLSIADHWTWDGTQYQRTAEAWLANMDARKDHIMPILETVYGRKYSQRWWMRWRMFFLAVSEMFGSHGGSEWLVGHYLFAPISAAADDEHADQHHRVQDRLAFRVVGAASELPMLGPIVVLAAISIHLGIVSQPVSELLLDHPHRCHRRRCGQPDDLAGWLAYPVGTF